MNKRLQGALAGILMCSVVSGGIALAKNATETIEVAYNNIRIFMDGAEIYPTDANGQNVEPFIYNGTTYLPVRAVGDAVNKKVSWDDTEKIVYLGTKPGDSWLDICGPYQYKVGEEYRASDNKYFTMSGEQYTNGFIMSAANYFESEAMFNLGSKYNSLTFTVGHVDNTALCNATMEIYLDGEKTHTRELKYDDVAKSVTIQLNGANQMKILLNSDYVNTSEYGFADGVFE